MSINFGKNIKDLSEDELFNIINNSQPEFGTLAQYELLRRLTIENSRSSERFAKGSAYLAIAGIIISFAIGAVQIYLSVQ